jgi:hypothetical protein
MPDLRVENHGSIALLIPQNETAREWLNDNVASEPWQWFGDGLAAEPRYVDMLIDGALDEGLEVEVA